MKSALLRLLPCLLAACVPFASAITINQVNVSYAENFDTLASTGTSGTVPAGWAFSEAGSGANATYTAGTGSSATGDTYSFGAVGSSERAFGTLLTGSLASSLGTIITNNTGGTLTQLTFSFYGEQWRLGATGREDRLDFAFSTDATSLTTGIWTANAGLSFVAPVTGPSTGALNGNAAANRTFVTGTISGLNLATGGSLWIRWSDLNASSSDDGLAIDDFSVTAGRNVIVPAPDGLHVGVAFAVMLALMLARRAQPA
ncbi:MAG: PEP-CTERM sorting domain-containing protein [Opitutaceae bacterium]